jgi:hypothetical protein
MIEGEFCRGKCAASHSGLFRKNVQGTSTDLLIVITPGTERFAARELKDKGKFRAITWQQIEAAVEEVLK